MEEILNRLKNIGAEEISKKTHITIAKVRAILNKDFEHLDRVGAVGFIHIIEREYKVNLGEWIEAYDRYYEENGVQKKEIELKANFIAKKEEIDKKEGGGKLWLFLSAIAVVVILFFTLLDKKEIDEISESIYSMLSSGANTQDSEGQKDGAEEIINIDEEKVIETKKLIDDELLVTSAPSDENISAIIADLNQTIAAKKAILESNISVITPEVKDTNQTAAPIKVTIEPKGKLWIGSINLKTKAKVTATVSTPFELNGEDPMLILTGHGNLNIIVGDNKESLVGVAPLRFKLDKDGLTKISFEEFKELNGGSGW